MECKLCHRKAYPGSLYCEVHIKRAMEIEREEAFKIDEALEIFKT